MSSTANAVVFDTYSDFVSYLQGRKCPICNISFIQSSKDVETLFKNWLGGAGQSITLLFNFILTRLFSNRLSSQV
jgi:hypothetical protein